MAAPHDPARQGTVSSIASTAAVPEEKIELATVLEERLRAWKHVVGYLKEYVEAAAHVQKSLGKEYEKLAKLVAEPLKEGHMFDTASANGVTGLFEHLRAATHKVSAAGYEAEKEVKGHVLKELEKLHKDIKNKDKELLDGALKGTKNLEKSRGATQKALEELGKHTAAYDAGQGSGRIEPANDPYLIKRGVLHKLNRQVNEENALKADMVVVQDNFKRYEQYIVQTLQQSVGSLYQYIGAQADATKAAYGDVVGVAQKIAPEYEWTGFTQRYAHILADASAPNRSVQAITFPNQTHGATTPLAAGALQRKGKLFGKYSTHHYVVTPAKYLHEFSDNDELVNDPEPELSLYLPDCTIGGLTPAPGAKFTISGKDSLKNQHLTREHEFTFKAGSHEEAKRFYDAIVAAVGKKTGGMTPPIVTPQASGDDTQIAGVVAVPEKQQPQQPEAQQAPPPAYEHNQNGNTVVPGANVTSSPVDEKPDTFSEKAAPAAAPVASSSAAAAPAEASSSAQPSTTIVGDKPIATVPTTTESAPAAAPAAPAPAAAPAEPAGGSAVKDVKFESTAKKSDGTEVPTGEPVKEKKSMFGSLKRGFSKKK